MRGILVTRLSIACACLWLAAGRHSTDASGGMRGFQPGLTLAADADSATSPGSENVASVVPGASWIQMSPAFPPKFAEGSCLADDFHMNRLFRFGGDQLFGGRPFPSNDLKELRLTVNPPFSPDWVHPVVLNDPPPAKEGCSVIYDPVRERLVMFGGGAAASRLFPNDVWALYMYSEGPPDMTLAWFMLSPSGPLPPGRVGHTAVYDTRRDRMIILGGFGGDPVNPGNLNDVWALSFVVPYEATPAWEEIHPGGDTSPTFITGGVYDAINDRVVVMAGSQAWQLSLADPPAWKQMPPPPPGFGQRFQSAEVYDPLGRGLVIFGGVDNLGARFNDVWYLTLDQNPTWNQIPVTGVAPPSANAYGPAVYDRVGDRMIIPSSVNAGGFFPTDTWSLNFSGRPRTDHPPVADAGPDVQVECQFQYGFIPLDGSRSSDPDSTPGTNDDIKSYEWFEDYGSPSMLRLGSGRISSVGRPFGTHEITLVTTDIAGATSQDTFVATVVDTTPPFLSFFSVPPSLWPPNHQMIDVSINGGAGDTCDPSPVVTLVSASSSEADDAPGMGDGNTSGDIAAADVGSFVTQVQLRAERDHFASGRTYTLTYRAVDHSGNSATGTAIVTVPHDQGDDPEPLIVQLSRDRDSGQTSLTWTEVPGSLGYDVIRGELSRVKIENRRVNLGAVDVLARGMTDTSLTEDEAGVLPEVGDAFFYLMQQRGPQGGVGYGTESAPWPRIPGSCPSGCP